MVKPRALAGSLGVVRAENGEAVRRAFALAESSRFADLPTGHGVLIEEYLDGNERVPGNVLVPENYVPMSKILAWDK